MPETAAPTPMTTAVPATDDAEKQTAAFFDALFGYAPENLHSLLWTMPDKRSTWVPLDTVNGGGPPLIAGRARTLADGGKDVYVAVSAAEKPGLVDTRIKADNSAGIMGLWADIDIATPDVHKKWNLPPSVEAAMELLHAAQCEPTLIVHSGHGLQAWWLWHEFWAFDDGDRRSEAAGLAQRWNTTLQVRAAERSWVVDSTFDLARVMRVPGTLNRKDPAKVVPVRLLHTAGPRYATDEIDAFCVDASFLAQRGFSPTRSYQPDEFEISDANKPDLEKFTALRDNDEVFAATFAMKRSAKEFPDQSPSAYDMSLADRAARAGWSDREIAALILFFRRQNRLDVNKALRPDYIRRTISRARDGIARDDATEALEEVGEALDEAKRSGDDEAIKETRRGGNDLLSQQIGIEFLHFIKYLSEPPLFDAVTPTCTIRFGGSDAVLSWLKFRQKVWETTGHQIQRMTPRQWDQVTALIPKVWVEQDVGSEATETGELTAWLNGYLSARPPVDAVDEAATSEYPYVEISSGRICLFGPAFRRWLWTAYTERVNPKELGRRLRAYGCEPDRVGVLVGGKRSSRAIWRLPVQEPES